MWRFPTRSRTFIERLVWDGHGCSISQASLSVMVDLVEGKTVDEAMELAGTFHKLMESRGKGLDDESAEESFGRRHRVPRSVQSIQCVSSARCSDGKA